MDTILMKKIIMKEFANKVINYLWLLEIQKDIRDSIAICVEIQLITTIIG